MTSLFTLLILAIVILAWYQLRGLHEKAGRLCRMQLQKNGLQLLDESVAFQGFSIGKPIQHCQCLQRCYRFEFTQDGDRRHHGQLWFCGKQPVYITLEREDGQTDWIHFKAIE